MLLTAAAVFLLVEIAIEPAASLASAIALAVLATLAAVWLTAMGIGVWRGRAWTRGAALVWQVLQIAVAVGSFQGAFARPEVGWVLLVPAVVVIGLLVLSRDVIEHLSRENGR